MNNTVIAMELLTGGQSSQISLSTTSAQGPVVARPTNHPAGVAVKCLLTPDAVCYVRKGTNPNAVSDGTDQKLLANVAYRVELMEGERIAVVMSTGTGTLSFTPGA